MRQTLGSPKRLDLSPRLQPHDARRVGADPDRAIAVFQQGGHLVRGHSIVFAQDRYPAAFDAVETSTCGRYPGHTILPMYHRTRVVVRKPFGRAKQHKTAVAQPVQATRPRPHPDTSLAVYLHGPDLSTSQPATGRHGSEPPVPPSAHAFTPGADPQSTLCVQS